MSDDFDDLLNGGNDDAAENNLALALRLAAQGFPVFPCREVASSYMNDGRAVPLLIKSPYGGKGGFHNATTDHRKIKSAWSRYPNALVGMPTGAKSGIAVMDLDRHEGKPDGVAGIMSMGKSPGDLTPVIAHTPSNGMHLFFKYPDGLGNSNSHILKGRGGIDVRGEGGYIIAPGTVMPDGSRYTDVRLSAKMRKELPDFPQDMLPPKGYRRDAGETGTSDSMGLSISDIRAYMNDVPNVNIGRDEWISDIASISHEAMAPDEFGAMRSESEIEEILQIALDWTASDPAYSDEGALNKVRGAFKSFKHAAKTNPRTFRSIAQKAIANRMSRLVDEAIEGFDDEDSRDHEDFDLLIGQGVSLEPKKKLKRPQKWESDDAPDWVKKMNLKYALIIVGGKTNIMRFKKSARGEDDHDLWDMKTFHDWHQALGTVSVQAGKGKSKEVTMSTAFLGNEYRRGYDDGYVFDTTMSNEKGFNLFTGWGVEPKRGDCSRILKHVKTILCRGDKEAYEYFLDYFAHMFQRPHELPRAAIVVKGEEGAGKDTWAAYIMPIIRRYVPKITGQDQFFANFNGFLKNAIFINLQESFVGSSQNNEKMKQYISDDMIKVENKYQNAHDTPNLMRLYITSNNFRVINASESDRRHLALKASSEFVDRGDAESARKAKDYFDAIYRERDNGGVAALLDFLLSRKIKNFPRIPPATEELSEQVAINWRGIKQFVRHCLIEGAFTHDIPNGDRFKRLWLKGPVRVEKSEFRDQFNLWCRGKSRFELDDFPPSAKMIGQVLSKMTGAKSTKGRLEGENKNIYVLPDLITCRQHMSVAARGKLSWDDEYELSEIMNSSDEKDDLE